MTSFPKTTQLRRLASLLISLRIDGLRTFPEMGRSVSQAPDPDSIRDFIFGKYVVRYTVHGTALVVLRIWHHYETSRGST